MKSFKTALRSLFKKGRKNFIKILSLGIGLSMGMVILAKVFFEQTYDDFYPDVDRIYRLMEGVQQGESSFEHGGVSGGVTLGMKNEIPEVEAATRIETMGEQVFFDSNKNRYMGKIILADEWFHDVLPRPVLIGDAKEIFSRPMYALVSEKIAKNLSGNIQDAIGKTFTLDQYPGRAVTIGGVFKDIPENTTLKYDIAISMPSFREVYGYDCTEGWLGCDRFGGYVKLYPGVTPEGIAPAVRAMQERHQNIEEIKISGVDLWYIFNPLQTYYSSQPEVKRMTIMLSLLAFALIFTGVMNYVLIVISTMVNRTKEVAVHKCYGASATNISGMLLSETFIHLILSLILAGILIFTFQSPIREILNASLSSLFTPVACLLLAGICIIVFLIAGLLPSYLLTRIPVAAAFRSYKQSRRLWKLALLFVQFIATSLLVTLLVIIGKQYELMVNDNPGYAYENLLFTRLRGVDLTQRERVLNDLLRLPEVAEVATSAELPVLGASGNNVYELEKDDELFNIYDLQEVSPNFLSVMEIPVIEGKSFVRGENEENTIMVSRYFADRMAELAGWTDGVVGKSLRITMHGVCNIIGVYEDIRIGSVSVESYIKPTAMFYSDYPNEIFVIKMNTVSPESTQKVYDTIKSTLTDKDVVVNYYKASMADLYTSSRLFRNAVMWGGIATLLISLIGLIGYTNDEISRRKSEIAVRRINGASLWDIQSLFSKDILYIAVPALVLGGLGAFLAAQKWMENFSEKTELSFLLFVGCGLGVLAIILSVVAINCYYTANDNPVNSLRSE